MCFFFNSRQSSEWLAVHFSVSDYYSTVNMADAVNVDFDQIGSLWRFLRDIEWQDPCMIALVTFHIIITSTAVLTRNNGSFQMVLFFFLLLLVYFSENINEVASNNWRSFSRHQYFDSKGMFISMVFSVPILLNCMVMVASWLYQSSQLMTKLKRAQLRQQFDALNSKNGGDGSPQDRDEVDKKEQ